MANDITGKVWKLDTAGVIATHPVYLLRMEWHPAAAGNDLLVYDGFAHYIWETVAVSATPGGDVEMSLGEVQWYNGFDLEKIDQEQNHN